MSSSAAPLLESGQLSQTPLPRLLIDLHRQRFEGRVQIRAGRQEKKIAFDKGFPVEAQSNLAGESLAQSLLDSGTISATDRDRILGYMRDNECRENVAVLSLELLDARQLLAALKEQTRRRIMEVFGWPEGEFTVEPGQTQDEAIQALRCDPLPIVRDGMATHWPIDRILLDLMPRMNQFVSPRKHFARLVDRVADADEIRLCLARMDGTRPLEQALGASVSAPVVAAAIWVVAAMEGLDFHARAREDGEVAATCFDSTIEIQVAGGGREAADRAASTAAGKNAGTQSGAAVDESRTNNLRAEVEKLYASLNDLDHYQLLGVKNDARGSAIKKAYFKAAKLYHPDTLARMGLKDLDDKAADVFAQIAEAFEVISNKRLRKDYDAVLRGELTDADATRLAQAETSYRKGDILLRMGDFAAALEYLNGAVEVWPDEGVYQAALGWALFKNTPSDPAAARAHLTRAVDLTPTDAVAHFRLGTVLRTLGLSEEAQRLLMIARQLDPNVG